MKVKKILLFVIVCIVSVPLLAQTLSNRLLVESNVHFFTREMGTLPYDPSANIAVGLQQNFIESNLQTSIGLGYTFLKKHAFGLLYNYSKLELDNVQSALDIDVNQGTSTVGNTLQVEDISTVQSYGFYYRYFTTLSKRFLFAPRLSTSWVKQEFNRYVFSYSGDNSIFNTQSYLNIQKFIRVNLEGMLSYQFNNWLALQAKLVSGTFQVRYDDSRYGPNDSGPKNIEANFDANPINWEIGVLLLLGKKKKTE